MVRYSTSVRYQASREMLLNNPKDFMKSEKWYADRGIPFRRGYRLPVGLVSSKSSLIHAIARELNAHA
ncbi:hypothetical protein FIBSPDRAFT_854365 [Athelia psychrophila]|uniref:Uncharacterized protein n=1 Tax=Athelia psychrophila TaxID=1759441 RepID=A0A166QDP7_9AGAM|nr:hypothetical protein FIBSPDRAFT_854365 [Fibularhizoctonia sp. CBS 109695]